MIPRGLPYEEAMRQFRWPTPKKLNIGHLVCERHGPATLAMIVENADGSVRNWTFGELLSSSSRLANALKASGIDKGDRVGVFLSQGAELTICHLAGYARLFNRYRQPSIAGRNVLLHPFAVTA